MAEKRIIFSEFSGKRQSSNFSKFILSELELLEKDKRRSNFLIQCSNNLDYNDVIKISKEISNTIFNDVFVSEQSIRCNELISFIDREENFFKGQGEIYTVTVVFIANQAEYSAFMFNDKTEVFLNDVQDNNGSFIFISPNNFNPFEIGNPSFIQNEIEDFVFPDYLKDRFLFFTAKEYIPDQRKVDLRDTVPMEMGAAFYSFSFKSLEQVKRWELVNVLKLNKKIIKELILDGTLEDINSKKKEGTDLFKETYEKPSFNLFGWVEGFKRMFIGFFSYSKTVF